MADFKEKAAAGLQELVGAGKVEQTASTTPEVVKEEVVDNVTPPVEPQTPPKAEETTTQLIDWDKEEEVKPQGFDFREFAKKVGIEAENEEDFISKLNSQKADPFEGLPTNLKKAVEYAKKGVDPLQLLKVNAVDYSQIDPVQLFEMDFLSKIPDKEQGKLALETMNVFQKQYEGLKLRNELEQRQRAAEMDLLSQVEASQRDQQRQREQFTNQLQSELGKVDSIENFKVLEKHRKAIYKEIAERGKNPRYETANGYDYQRHIRDSFITSNWDALKGHLMNKAKVETIKEELKQVQNVDIGRNTERLPVEPSAESIHDKLARQARERIKQQVK
jgi:hypothetical protein